MSSGCNNIPKSSFYIRVILCSKNFFRFQMDRLEADLRFYMRELEGENDPFRRHIVQQRIVATQRAILALMVREREELDRQNSNMERALEIIRKREEERRK